jgi:tungstate transport system substrate-binding protein
MRLGVDNDLMQSGLARALERSFELDTGIPIKLISGSAVEMLEATELGDHDAVLSNAAWLDAQIEKLGLLHDRRLITLGSLALVGPTALSKALGARNDVVVALQRLADVKNPFIGAPAGSGTQLAEPALWRAAAVTPDPAWYRTVVADHAGLIAHAQELEACFFMELGTWLAQPKVKGYGILVQGDPRLSMPIHVLRSFRVNHPAGKLFVGWISGPKGRQLTSGLRGYRSAT